jgi:hypothetical protein
MKRTRFSPEKRKIIMSPDEILLSRISMFRSQRHGFSQEQKDDFIKMVDSYFTNLMYINLNKDIDKRVSL